MTRIDIHKLSQKFTVRKLVEDDVNMIYEFCKKNQLYYQILNQKVSKESIVNDMNITPPDIPISQKYYIGFFEKEKMICLMDLIDGHPDEKTAYIGFFMIEKELHNQGIGTQIINYTSSVLHELGFTHCRLGVDQNNSIGIHFWQKNGFHIINKVQRENNVILVAEKELNL